MLRAWFGVKQRRYLFTGIGSLSARGAGQLGLVDLLTSS